MGVDYNLRRNTVCAWVRTCLHFQKKNLQIEKQHHGKTGIKRDDQIAEGCAPWKM